MSNKRICDSISSIITYTYSEVVRVVGNNRMSARRRDKKKNGGSSNNNAITSISNSAPNSGACAMCNGRGDEEYVLLCDGEGCTHEIHMFCLQPPMLVVPPGTIIIITIIIIIIIIIY